MPTPHITSPSNPRVKNVVHLTTNRHHREETHQTVVEGSREVRRCLDAGVVPAEVYLCPELIAPDDQDLSLRLATDYAILRTSARSTV